MGKSYFMSCMWYHLLKVKHDVVTINGLHIIRSRKGSEDRTLSQWRTITVRHELDMIFLADPNERLPLPAKKIWIPHTLNIPCYGLTHPIF